MATRGSTSRALGRCVSHASQPTSRQSCQLRSQQHDPVLVLNVSDNVPPRRPACAVLAMRRLRRRSQRARNTRTSRHVYMPVRSLLPGTLASGTVGFSHCCQQEVTAGPPARDTKPASPMDCTPPIGAEVLLPLSNAPAAMEVEVQPLPLSRRQGSRWSGPRHRAGRAQIVAPSGR